MLPRLRCLSLPLCVIMIVLGTPIHPQSARASGPDGPDNQTQYGIKASIIKPTSMPMGGYAAGTPVTIQIMVTQGPQTLNQLTYTVTSTNPTYTWTSTTGIGFSPG